MEKIKLFYGTSNGSKLHNMRYRLRDYPITVVSPEDLGISLKVSETGKSVIQNALIKARAYFEVVNMPTVAADSSVYFDGLSDEEQPGLYVRRVDGRRLTNDEMIEHYALLAKNADHPYIKHCITGIALITESDTKTTQITDYPRILTSIPNSNRNHSGNPFDVITVTEDGRYFNELSDEERAFLDRDSELEFTEFIVNNLLKEKK